IAPIKVSIKKVRRFVKAITSSSTIAQDFKEIEQSVGEGEVVRKIPQDISTRWNSTYLILSVYMSMSTLIAAVMRHHSNLVYYRLSQEEDSDLQAEYSESGLNNLPTNMTSNSGKVLNSMTCVEKNEATLPMNINPLKWWKLNSFHFPQMAKDFLAIQTTSVPSEQIFSKAGDTIQAKRARLSEKSIQSLMCTGSWLEHGIKFHKD
ncbi:23000_t:CDS:2, partial [Racocetra persica]